MHITNEAINQRFFLAVDALKDSNQFKGGMQAFATKYGFSRTFISYARTHPQSLLRPDILANFCADYKISTDYLLLGEGSIFK